MTKLLFTALLLNSLGSMNAQQSDSTEQQLLSVLRNFTMSITEKDSSKFMALFFERDVAFTGIMTRETEWSIKKDYPEFQGLAVSTAQKFIREICASPTYQIEKVWDLNIQHVGPVAHIEFDYSFHSDGEVIQWGHERWNLVFAEGKWLITDVIYSIRFPDIEPVPQQPRR
jgi:hypothetical protein